VIFTHNHLYGLQRIVRNKRIYPENGQKKEKKSSEWQFCRRKSLVRGEWPDWFKLIKGSSNTNCHSLQSEVCRRASLNAQQQQQQQKNTPVPLHSHLRWEGSEFALNNMKVWICPALYEPLRLVVVQSFQTGFLNMTMNSLYSNAHRHQISIL